MQTGISYVSHYFDDPPRPGRAMDVWIPKKGALCPVTILFIHGGGWRNGHRDQMHALMHSFYAKGYACVSVDYSLGDVTVPIQLADVREGIAAADRLLRENDIAQPFVLYGSSAGGHLALLAGLAPRGACGETFAGEIPVIAGIVASCAPVSFQPWADIFPGSWDSMQTAVGTPYEKAPELYERVSPQRYAHAASPPLFFLLGECEHMFPNAQTIQLVERLNSEGGTANCRIYPAAEHGFFYALHRASQQMAFQDVLAFLETLPRF